MNVEIITIGDEILQGQIVDTNSAWIAKQFLPLHYPVIQITSIADTREAIRSALEDAHSRASVILITGGLGPTKDDVTKQTAAEYFKTTLVRDEKVLTHVKTIFERIGKDMPKTNETQADVLACGRVLFNEYGTAPGMWVEQDDCHFVFMPGVPFEMKYLMQKFVIPYFLDIPSATKIRNQYLLTAGIGESHLAEMIRDIEVELPEHIKLAYLPRIGLVSLRLTGFSSDEVTLEREMVTFSDRLSTILQDYLVATENIGFEEALIQLLQKRGLTVGTAESCTGGNIAHKLTEIPGSSSVFMGGVVSYANDVKMNVLGVKQQSLDQYGAVSEDVVRQMAEGARRTLNVDFAVATSGIAGPTGGTPEKPVGTVWIAVASPEKTVARKFQFHHDRLINIERATQHALLMLWNMLKNQYR